MSFSFGERGTDEYNGMGSEAEMYPQAGTEIYIQSFKHNGSLHRTWCKGFVVEADEAHSVVITNKAWVILSPFQQYLLHTLQLILPSYYRIQLPLKCSHNQMHTSSIYTYFHAWKGIRQKQNRFTSPAIFVKSVPYFIRTSILKGCRESFSIANSNQMPCLYRLNNVRL